MLKKISLEEIKKFWPEKAPDINNVQKYVSKCMNRQSLNLGGEQSGHMILADYSNAGDGLITSLQVLSVLVENKKKSKSAF